MMPKVNGKKYPYTKAGMEAAIKVKRIKKKLKGYKKSKRGG